MRGFHLLQDSGKRRNAPLVVVRGNQLTFNKLLEAAPGDWNPEKPKPRESAYSNFPTGFHGVQREDTQKTGYSAGEPREIPPEVLSNPKSW